MCNQKYCFTNSKQLTIKQRFYQCLARFGPICVCGGSALKKTVNASSTYVAKAARGLMFLT